MNNNTGTGTVNTHYPSYNVLDRLDEWDSRTKEIVRRRMGPFPALRFFTEREARFIAAVARNIIYDEREDIINWIVHHFDEKLSNEIGEDQRKVGIPPEKVLVRQGLEVLDHVSRNSFGKDFLGIGSSEQFRILADLQQGKCEQTPEFPYIPQKELFTKLATEIVSAYYSHPAVWSEIGYGGPMYPGIYVRIETGLTDPWEAKINGK